MEELIDAIILEEEKDNNLLVYCMSDNATDSLGGGEDEGFYSILIGKYLMNIEIKFRKLFQVPRDIVYVIF
jgi:hypothetical protein